MRTVAQLIETLSQYPPDSRVVVNAYSQDDERYLHNIVDCDDALVNHEFSDRSFEDEEALYLQAFGLHMEDGHTPFECGVYARKTVEDASVVVCLWINNFN